MHSVLQDGQNNAPPGPLGQGLHDPFQVLVVSHVTRRNAFIHRAIGTIILKSTKLQLSGCMSTHFHLLAYMGQLSGIFLDHPCSIVPVYPECRRVVSVLVWWKKERFAFKELSWGSRSTSVPCLSWKCTSVGRVVPQLEVIVLLGGI
jgi:hypothetical protein